MRKIINNGQGIIDNGQLTMDNSELPKGWEVKKLGDVCDIRSGRDYKKIIDTNGEYPIIGSSGKPMGYTNQYICKAGTTIIGRKGTINSPLYIETNFWNVDTAFGLQAYEGLYKKYLFLFCLFFDFSELDKGSGRPSLVKSDLKQIPIPLPPLPEQKRIVSILDRAFEAIDKAKANAEQNLKNAKELFESYLQGVFENKDDDWEEKTLGAICDIRTGKLNANAMVENGKYPFFTCSREIYSINDYAFDCKAVLLAGNNASGDFNVKIYTGKFNAYQRTYVITTTNEFKLELLKYKLENHLSELKKQSVGANTRFLKLAMIKDIVLNYPKNITEQQQIVQKLDSLSAKTKKLESIYQQKINDLEELKKSILQKAFEGKLTIDNGQWTVNNG